MSWWQQDPSLLNVPQPVTLQTNISWLMGFHTEKSKMVDMWCKEISLTADITNLCYKEVNRPHKCPQNLSITCKLLVRKCQYMAEATKLWNHILNTIKLYSLLIYRGQLASGVHQWQEQLMLSHLQSCHPEQSMHVQ